MSMNTVLLAIGSRDEERIEELVDTAASIVGPDGNVVLLHVFDRDQYDTIEAHLQIDENAEISPDDISERSLIVSEAASRLEAAGVEYTVRGALGDVADAILRRSDSEDADLVVVGGRSRSATGKALFGSTAQKVLLESAVPVTFVKERSAKQQTAAVPA
ncbi:universal stress protein [Halobellus sp. EA9]|uniref:universal stress protein n=1 Tax=Halobellus sp. EA9 TaxID=3421647 RepID=UPI003EBC5803